MVNDKSEIKRILITGANGQVGRELKVLAEFYPDWEFYFTGSEDLDITEASSVQQFFDQHQINTCINCAAYTAVDKAETDEKTARLVNVAGVENLAKTCAISKATLIHYSTDYVYHGHQNRPYQETDATNPQGVYATTKLEGDLKALAIHPHTLVIRTSWVYSSFGHNFVKTMLRLGADRDKLTVIFDQIGTPTYARDIAAATLLILEKLDTLSISEVAGIYHYSNEGIASWYDFAKAIFELRNISCHVLPIETKDYPTPAARPHFSVLNKAKIKTTFGLEIPHWRESLENCLKELE